MTIIKRQLLSDFFTAPEICRSYSLKDWELLIRHAQSAYVSVAVLAALKEKALVAEAPEKAIYHLTSEELMIKRQNDLFFFELNKIVTAIGSSTKNTILLKGAAYLALDLPWANTRRMADIDLLVEKSAISVIEKELLFHGWMKTKTDDYDEMYYREWMHEIPPVQHMKRGTVLDIHHNILPIIQRNAPNPNRLIADTRSSLLEGYSCLSPTDMVLHSACHLFHEGEFEKGFRDLYDLHRLLSYYDEKVHNFEDQLFTRAFKIGLVNELLLATRYTAYFFQTALAKRLEIKLNRKPAMVIDYCFKKVLTAHHPSNNSLMFQLAKAILYWRGHLLKMPMRILLPHLLKKTIKQIKEKQKKRNEPDDKTGV